MITGSISICLRFFLIFLQLTNCFEAYFIIFSGGLGFNYDFDEDSFYLFLKLCLKLIMQYSIANFRAQKGGH